MIRNLFLLFFSHFKYGIIINLFKTVLYIFRELELNLMSQSVTVKASLIVCRAYDTYVSKDTDHSAVLGAFSNDLIGSRFVVDIGRSCVYVDNNSTKGISAEHLISNIQVNPDSVVSCTDDML